MKIEGLFLASRAGRRIFWTLLIAAAGPIVLFGASAYDALSEHFAAQEQRQRVQATKYAGLALLDNLLVARTVLGILARTGEADKETRIGNRRGQVLADVATVGVDGRVRAGSAALWQRWQHMVVLDGTDKTAGEARLVVGDEGEGEAPPPVLMTLRIAEHPDVTWIAEIDRAYLFGEFGADATGERICVLDGRGRALFCPTAVDLAAHRSAASDGASTWQTSWNLFLRSDFGVPDWTLVNVGDVRAGPMPGGMSLARMTALGTLASVLFVVMLSLVQVRRTMVPLERLTAGTRRLSAQDYAARVPDEAQDEFGELARSFNDMAARIGRQIEAMQVQSSIDREILNGLDIARILQQVARRLQQLIPGAQVSIVQFDREARSLARVHHPDESMRVINLARTDAIESVPSQGEALSPCDPQPRWLAQVLGRPCENVYVQWARSGGEALALLVLGVDGAPIALASIVQEIDELRDRVRVALAAADREQRLVERATRDSLTGLANRAGLLEHLDRELAHAGESVLSLLFVDLDRFKDVNDSMGHQAGDELLGIVARRLRACVPADTLVARPSGDEFVLVSSRPRDEVEALAGSILVRLATPIALHGRTLSIGASIGMARCPEHADNAADLIRRADMAMYDVKLRGGGEAAWFEDRLDARITERAMLRADLHLALQRGEFEMHYQPRVDARSGRVRSAEALLRWRHPDKGLVPPGAFIDILEEGPLIDEVGLWAIETACRQAAQWRTGGVQIGSVAVNVSTRQLHAPDFPERVISILRRCGLPASALELEITESIFVGGSADAIARLHALRDAGLRLALDDFGTGYSSLSYLHKLPIHVLKVDRSFVAELGVRDSALTLARSIVALARALDLHVIAEGIETLGQANMLRALGCDELQGYLFAKPLPPDQIGACIERLADPRATEALAAH
jgi:diguanylate cyclase (GGDEF)-like protein